MIHYNGANSTGSLLLLLRQVRRQVIKLLEPIRTRTQQRRNPQNGRISTANSLPLTLRNGRLPAATLGR